jgi:transcriptional regulator GlxA family with amidase domain
MWVEPSVSMARLDDIRISYVVALIEGRFAEPCAVDELARAANLSPSYLTRLFRRQTGRSPASFVREVRLRRAYELVQTTFLSIKEVMAAVGWNDPSHFSRAFKGRFGVSPHGLREALQREFAAARRA